MQNTYNDNDNIPLSHIEIDDTEDEYSKILENEIEQISNVYINSLELIEDKPYEELLSLSKEEIIQFKNLQITQLKAYINSLEKEKEDLITEFKLTTDTLLEKIKDLEYSNKGIRPQTATIVHNLPDKTSKAKSSLTSTNQPNSIIQRCPNCTKEFPINAFIEHSLQCLRKMYRCPKCELSMVIEQKEDHYLLYRNKMKMIECVKSNDCDFFKKCIQHEFPVNEMLIIETGDTLIHVLVKYNRTKMVKFVMTSNVGVDINKKNKSDLTALMLCCKNGNEAMARELIKNGANVNEKNILGDTALKLAQINKHDTLALMLLNNYKADIGLSKKY